MITLRINAKIFLYAITTVLLFSAGMIAQVNSKGIKPLSDVTKNPGTVRAVIIGISKYQNIQSLKYADDDAVVFYNFLLSETGRKVDSSNVRLLINEEATQGNIFKELMWLIDESQPNDIAIIYFSGHGDIETKTIVKNGFLLAYDCPKAVYYAGGAIQVENLKAFTTTMSSKKVKVIIITDACRSGTLAGGLKGVEQTTLALKQEWKNEIKIMSSKPGQLSYESSKWGRGRGVFSYYLVNGLIGLADSDNDGKVTAFELQNYLYSHVKEETHPLDQTPTVSGDLDAVINKVNEKFLAQFKANQKDQQNDLLAVVEAGKGVDEFFNNDKDTIYKKTYLSFKKALDEKRLIEPANNCAYGYYKELLASNNNNLINFLKRNLGAVLQNEAQQVINKYITENVFGDNAYFKAASDKMKLATLLLGKDHPLYNSYKARQLFLEARSYTEKSKMEIEKGIKLLQESIKIEPNAAYSFNTLGILYNSLNKNEKALTFYQKASNLAPKWAIPISNIGSYYNQTRQYEKAIKYAKKAIELDPEFAFGYSNLADAYSELSDKDKSIDYYNKAIENYKRTIEINPENTNSYIGIGIVYYNLKKYEKALENYKRAIEINPDYAYSYYDLGIVYNDLKQYDSAIVSYKKAIEINPEYANAYNGLGTVYDDLQQYDSAIVSYKKAIEIKPDYAYAYNNLGLAYYANKEYDKAITSYKKAIEINPEYESPYNGIGIVYYDLKQYDSAIVNYKKAIKINPEYESPYNGIGNVYYNMEQYDSAIVNYKKAIEIKTDYAYAYNNLGLAYYANKEYDKAITSYKKAVEINPEYANAYNGLGTVYYNLQEYDSAIVGYKKAIELNPDFAEAYYNLGLAYNANKEYDKAITSYKKAIEINPEYTLAYYKLGNVYYNLKQYDSAIVNYKKAIEVKPNFAEAYNNLGLVYYNLKEFDKSIDSRKKAVEVNPDYASAYYNLGAVYFETKEYDKSKLNFMKVIELNPEYATAYYRLGIDLYYLKRFEKAISNFKKALELEPESFPQVYLLIGAIYDENLKNFDKSILNHSKYIKLYPERIKGYRRRAYAYLHKDDNTNALKDFKKVIELKPGDPGGYYDLACFYSLQKNGDNSLGYLEKALSLGYDNFKHISEDSDLDNIRNSKEFKDLIKKYLEVK